MREGERPSPAPDPTSLRDRGNRYRRRRQGAIAGLAAATVAALVAALLVVAGGLLHHDRPQPVDHDGTRTLNSYERRVLAEWPGAYAVGGEVVISTPVDPELPIWLQSQVDGVDGRLAPLGWHSLTPASDVPLFDRLAGPAFMRSGEMPERTQAYQDSGPMRIGCRRAPGVSCGLFLVVGSDSVGWFTGDRLGDDAFLQPVSRCSSSPAAPSRTGVCSRP